MTIYLVTVNSKVSQVAYKTLEQAQDFIRSRVDPGNEWSTTPYYRIVDTSGIRYEIHDVKVK